MRNDNSSREKRSQHRVFERRTVLKSVGAMTTVGGVAGLAGCFGAEDGNGDGEAGDDGDEDIEDLPEVEMTIHHLLDPSFESADHRAAVTFQEFMERRTGGRFQVDIAPAGELAGDVESIEQAQEGAIEMVKVAGGHLAPFYPNINAISVPYAFPNIDVANYVFQHEFGDTLREGIRDELGLVSIGNYDNGGFRDYSANEPLTGPESFEGLSIRNMDIEPHMEITRQLGASPEPIDWTELYEALDTGVVDGQENAIPTFLAGSLQEVQDYFILDHHVYSLTMTLANGDWYDDLHPTYQELVEHGMTLGARDAERVNRLLRNHGIEIMEDAGVEVYEPTEDEMEEFQEITQEPVIDVIEDIVDDPGLIDELLTAADEAEDALGM